MLLNFWFLIRFTKNVIYKRNSYVSGTCDRKDDLSLPIVLSYFSRESNWILLESVKLRTSWNGNDLLSAKVSTSLQEYIRNLPSYYI